MADDAVLENKYQKIGAKILIKIFFFEPVS